MNVNIVITLHYFTFSLEWSVYLSFLDEVLRLWFIGTLVATKSAFANHSLIGLGLQGDNVKTRLRRPLTTINNDQPRSTSLSQHQYKIRLRSAISNSLSQYLGIDI